MRRALLPALLVALLGGAPARADVAVERALEALSSPDASLRAEAARALGSVTDTRVREAGLPLLVAHVEDPADAVRAAVADALEAWGDPRAAAPLAARISRESQPDVLASLLLALGKCGTPGDAPPVAALARAYPAVAVRAAAVTALGDLGGELARSTVRDLLVHPVGADALWSFRSACLLALAACGTADDVGVALVAYREGGGEAHWFARASLARLVAARDTDPLPLLRHLLADDDVRVAVTAAAGLARRGGIGEAAARLQDVRPAVRAAMASGIGQARLGAAYPRLRLLVTLDPSREVRWASALALFRVGDPAADAWVVEAVGARDPAIWAEAVAALAERTGESHGRDQGAWRAALRAWRERTR